MSFGPEFETSAANCPTIRKLWQLYWNDPSFWDNFLRHAAIPKTARRLVGTPVALVFHPAFLNSSLVGNAILLHQDQALWRHDYPHAVSIRVTPSRANRESGGLTGSVGSYRSGLLPHRVIPATIGKRSDFLTHQSSILHRVTDLRGTSTLCTKVVKMRHPRIDELWCS